MATAAVRVRISGHVQGVGYRAWAEREALSLGLSGWARNRRDGTVEALVAGPRAAVDAFLARCRDGPAAARGGNVVTEPHEGPIPAGFTVLSTL